MPVLKSSSWLLAAVALSFWAMPSIAAADDAAEARAVLDASGVRCGLCVHLGAGSQKSPGLAAELAANSRMLVHGLAVDEGSLKRARTAAEKKGLLGQVIVERVALDPLPHVRDLANLVVIEDMDALAAAGLKRDEVDRILQPGGVLSAWKDGRWTKSVKLRPKEMDDWTHPAHGPDGNMVSADRLVQFPVGLRWLDGVPMNFNLWAACRGWVIGGGRCFTISTTELENLGPACFVKHKEEEYVTARDAFNGLPLWKVSCGTTNEGKGLNSRNIAPLVTDGARVYVFRNDRLVALDAATGGQVVKYPAKYPSVEIVLSQNVLVSSGWQAKEEAKDSGRDPLWSHWVAKTPAGAVEAFDAQQGTAKWSVPSTALEILAGDGLAYLLIQSGNPASAQEIQAIDLQSGRRRWRVPHTQFASELGLHLASAGPGVLAVARTKAKAISILSAADGKLLWEIKPTENYWTPVVDGLIWNGNRMYDPQTGEVKGTLPAGISSGGCTPSAIVGNLVATTRGGGYIEFSPAEDAKPRKATMVSYRAVRGACIEGTTPANGMFYTGQNFCRCTPGQVPGFVAWGPNGDLPAAADFEQARPVERGLAADAVKPGAASPGDWPTYRHDAARSGATTVRVPSKLKTRWQVEAARPADGPLAPAWKARLAADITAPVVAEGRVFVAAVEAGQIVALDAASGRPAWRATAGGRIDSPPTIYRGLCLFGSHDGWVYALRAADGQLVWRTRGAPWERRMVAFGQVESVWPALGSVLVSDGVLYATAGRTTESDGGVAVCALDPTTGRQLWGRAITPGPGRQNDLLVLRDGRLAMHHVQIDPKTGRYETPAPKNPNVSLEGLIDGTWTRLGNRRSGNFSFGKANAEMFVFDDATVFGYQCGPRSCYAIARSKTEGEGKLANQDYAWRSAMPPGRQVEAMVLCPDALVVAGRVCDPKSDRPSGFLATISLGDGKRIADYALDCPPAYDGLAVANEQVVVSLQNGKVVSFEGDQ